MPRVNISTEFTHGNDVYPVTCLVDATDRTGVPYRFANLTLYSVTANRPYARRVERPSRRLRAAAIQHAAQTARELVGAGLIPTS